MCKEITCKLTWALTRVWDRLVGWGFRGRLHSDVRAGVRCQMDGVR